MVLVSLFFILRWSALWNCLSQWSVHHPWFLMTVQFYLYHLGISYSIGSERWTVEKCLYANGRRTLEAAIEQGLLHIRRNKEGAFPVTSYQWKKVILRWLAFPLLEFMKGFCIICNLRNWLSVIWKVWCCKK